MQIDQLGLDLIEGFEGLYLTTYIDPVGVATIGYGHTGADVTPGRTITEAEANQILAQDVKTHGDAVGACVTVTLQQCQFDALTSFAFNVGDGALEGSTLLKKLNQGDYNGAADEFLVWNKGHVDGELVELPGLTRRRKSERHLFLTGKLDFYDGKGEETELEAAASSAAPAPASTPDPSPQPSPKSASTTPPKSDAPEAPSNPADPNPAAPDSNTEFDAMFASWGITHFTAAEVMDLGDANADPSSPAYGMNTPPPRQLWPNMKLTIQVLDRLRDVLGAPITIVSAYRNATYNERVGGAPDSLHLQFNALEFHASGDTGPADWAAALKDMRENGDFKGGIGVYSTCVDVDTRGYNADW